MKTLKKIFSIFILAFPLAVISEAAVIPEDDIYIKKGEKNSIVEKKQKENSVRPSDNKSNGASGRDIDEYNRRRSSDGIKQMEKAADEENKDDQSGYVNGFSGSDNDFQYAERIRRFHDPRFIIHIGDPAYSEIYFLDNYDWNVYVDGNYAWVTPTWTNRTYWNYMWSPYSYAPSWRFGIYGSSWGFGYSAFNSPWYSPYGYYGGYYPYIGYMGYCGYHNYGYGYGYGYGHGFYGYGNYSTQRRYDNGLRPSSDYAGRRSERGVSNNPSIRSSSNNSGGRTTRSASSMGNDNISNPAGRSSRYTTVPSTRSVDENSTTNRTNGDNSSNTFGRSSRYTTVPSTRSVDQNTVPSNTNNNSGYSNSTGGRTSRYSEPSGNRSNYSTGSSDQSTRSVSSTPNYNSGSYSSGRSSSYSTPSSDPGSSRSSVSSGSSSPSSGRSSGGRR